MKHFYLRDIFWLVLVVAAGLDGYCWRDAEVHQLKIELYDANQEVERRAWQYYHAEDKLAYYENRYGPPKYNDLRQSINK